MRRLFVRTVVCFLFCAVSTGISYGADLDNYITMKLGAYTPNSNDLKGFNSGFSGEVAFGHYLSKNAALELGAGYSRTEGDFYGYTFETGNYHERDKIEMKPVTMSLKFIFPADFLEFYVLGGMGANFVHAKIDVSTAKLGNIYLSDEKVAFLGQLGGGVNFNVSPNMFLGIEGKYIWSSVDLQTSGISFDTTLDGSIVTANFGLRF